MDISRNQPPEIVFRGQFSHNQGRSPPARESEEERGNGRCRTPWLPLSGHGGEPGASGSTAFRQRLGRPGRSGKNLILSLPSSPGDARGWERGPGTATRGTAGNRRGGLRLQGTPGRNTGHVWGLRLSPFPAGRSGFSRLFHAVTQLSRRRASRVISSSCLVRG